MNVVGKLVSGILLASLVAAVTFYGYSIWEKERNRTVEVLTVSQEIPPRTMITQEMFDDGIIKVSKHPAVIVPPNVFRSPEEVIGKFTVTNYTVPQNSYLYKGKVLPPEEMKDGAEMLLKPGERMVAIQVNLKSSLAAQITQGSYIDLWFSGKTKEDQRPVVGPFLEKVRVVGTYTASSQKSRSTDSDVPKSNSENPPVTIGVNLVPQTILLAVNNEQAGYIQLAEELGEINVTGVGYEEMHGSNTAAAGTQPTQWSIEHMREWMKSRMSETFQVKK
ncbi:Flp pilus assembly protein CpaB [Brevibacillus marinus]|uniref:Flp pilus assembly protein CpaB n=1 Tax=Brevibacillus marinus TaxID=2496837 RepID=UPI000F831E70|nr:Flp pilus assembly protein CpaB [Brevibacillus marinus]